VRTLDHPLVRAVLVAAATLGVVLLLLAVQGVPPAASLVEILRGAFGNAAATATTLRLFVPLCLCATGIAVAFRAGLWNIGAEGQFLVGAIAGFLGGRLGGHWALALASGTLAGALWASVPALLRELRQVPEVLSSIMLNFVALELLRYVLRGPLQEPSGQFLQSAALPAAARLPEQALGDGGSLHLGLPLVLLLALAAGAGLARTRPGLLIRAVGSNPRAVAAGGFRVGPLRILAFGVSGACAGLAGAIELSGASRLLDPSLAHGVGYAAIAVALLAGLRPILVIPSALLFATLESGTSSLQWLTELPGMDRFARLVQGLIIFAILFFLGGRAARRSAPRHG
jgi:simple sugar transport system permease protein